jgi:hypothetical protein
VLDTFLFFSNLYSQPVTIRGAMPPFTSRSYKLTVSLLFCVFLTGVVTDSLKVAIGRPRPNFYFQCWPNGTFVWQPGTGTQFGVGGGEAC